MKVDRDPRKSEIAVDGLYQGCTSKRLSKDILTTIEGSCNCLLTAFIFFNSQ